MTQAPDLSQRIDPTQRRRIEEMVRPLYAGLDGVQTFDRVEILHKRIAELKGDEAIHQEFLELLLLFHGAVDRIGSLKPGGRLDLFLRGIGVSAAMSTRLRQGLGRLGEEPKGPEEALLADALLLESAGVGAVARRLMLAGKRRTPLSKALPQLDAGPVASRFHTQRGAEIAARRRQAAEAWIDELKLQVAEEEAWKR